MSNNVPKQHQHWSWIIALSIALVLIVWLFIIGYSLGPTKNQELLTTAILILSLSIGWAIGTFLSPDSGHEANKFSDFVKGFSLFASGYLVSKGDRVVDWVLKPDMLMQSQDQVIPFRLVASLAVVVFTALATYFIRIYGLTVGDR